MCRFELRTFAIISPTPYTATSLRFRILPALHLNPFTPFTSQVQQHKCQQSWLVDVERLPQKGHDIRRPESAFILFHCKCCEDRQQEGASESPIKKQHPTDLSKTVS